jgi:uncharacterized membrane protein YtjA (UPF0391 family)
MPGDLTKTHPLNRGRCLLAVRRVSTRRDAFPGSVQRLMRSVGRQINATRPPRSVLRQSGRSVFRHRIAFAFLEGGVSMLRWAILFLIVAIIAGVFGFGGIAAAATDIARLLFVVFLVLFVIALFMGRRGTSPPL